MVELAIEQPGLRAIWVTEVAADCRRLWLDASVNLPFAKIRSLFGHLDQAKASLWNDDFPSATHHIVAWLICGFFKLFYILFFQLIYIIDTARPAPLCRVFNINCNNTFPVI